MKLLQYYAAIRSTYSPVQVIFVQVTFLGIGNFPTFFGSLPGKLPARNCN